ncbi:MAG: SDR family oxidoreductase [Gammaproteobacteria bacterium]|nr:SDR family oxidoreductase [Gammaproteobacteria bacterium]
MTPSPPVLIVGCGYVGQRLARQLRAEGRDVTGLVRSAASAAALQALGVTPVQVDLDAATELPAVPTAGVELYYFAPPPAEGDTDPRLRRVLAALTAGLPRRIVYISTSGVYGDCAGAWVDETCPLKPSTPRARRRADAEATLREWSATSGVPVVVLRVPGIYGPGKLPLERLRKGLPLLHEVDSPYTNRIQVDDLIAVCRTAMNRGMPGAAYNVSDGQPSNMTDYFNRIADATGLPRPPLIARADIDRLSPGMRAFMEESKRLDNRRMREELGVELRYPTLEVGLNACLDACPAENGLD